MFHMSNCTKSIWLIRSVRVSVRSCPSIQPDQSQSLLNFWFFSAVYLFAGVRCSSPLLRGRMSHRVRTQAGSRHFLHAECLAPPLFIFVGAARSTQRKAAPQSYVGSEQTLQRRSHSPIGESRGATCGTLSGKPILGTLFGARRDAVGNRPV